MLELYCPFCQEKHPPKETVQVFSNKTVHVRGECANCGSFIKFVPHSLSSLNDERLNKAGG